MASTSRLLVVVIFTGYLGLDFRVRVVIQGDKFPLIASSHARRGGGVEAELKTVGLGTGDTPRLDIAWGYMSPAWGSCQDASEQ